MQKWGWVSRTAGLIGAYGAIALVPHAAAVEVGGGGEQGAVAGIGYVVSIDEETQAIEVCLGANGESSTDGGIGGVGGAAGGNVCVTLTPPAPPVPPASGISDPLSVVVQVGIPTPEGLATVDVGAFVDANEPSICVAISAGGPGIEPESVEVCLPPSGDGLPEPELPELPGLPGGLPGLPALPGAPELPVGSELPDLPGDLPVPTDLLGDLPILGGGSGGPLDPVLSLLDGLGLVDLGDVGIPGDLPPSDLDGILEPVLTLLGGLGLPPPPSL